MEANFDKSNEIASNNRNENDSNCLLCTGQMNSRSQANKIIEGKCGRLELKDLQTVLLQLILEYQRKNNSTNDFLSENITIASKECIDSITNINKICNKCNDLIFDYHTISLRLENIRNILCPWLLLLVQKFKRNEGDGKQKFLIKDYQNDEGKKKTSNEDCEGLSKGKHKMTSRKVDEKVRRSKTCFEKGHSQNLLVQENKDKNEAKTISDRATKLDPSSNLLHPSIPSKPTDLNTKSTIEPNVDDTPIFVCSLCKKIFTKKRNLKNHMKFFHCPDDASFNESFKFKCDLCDKRFYKKNNLESHRLKHSSIKAFKCPVEGCESQFKRLKALNFHQNKKHKDNLSANDTHLCSFCGKCFETQSGLKSHIGKHTGVAYVKRNHACLVCGKLFRCKTDLDTHSVVHTKEKPFSCPICHLSFTQRASLKDHQNVHENKYQCSFCQKSFGRERYLSQHKTSCHKSHQTKDSSSQEIKTNKDTKSYDSSENTEIEKFLESNAINKNVVGTSKLRSIDSHGPEHQNFQMLHQKLISAPKQGQKLADGSLLNSSSPIQTQILTINHEGNTHHIEIPVSSLVAGQFIDVSEMGLVIANQSSDVNHSTKRGEAGEILDLSAIQYVRIVNTNEGPNSVALQPVIIPQ